MLFDTHCHLYDERFDGDREQILSQMEREGMTPLMLVGADVPSSLACQALSKTRPFLYFAAGVHPHDAKDYDDRAEQAIKTLLADPRCAALGEIGLDYYYDHSPREVQRRVFLRQLDIAAERGKPVVFHVRDAHGELTDLLRARKGTLPPGVMHCYSGSPEQARIYLDMGFYISLAGPVTFAKAPNLVAVAQMVPENRLLIETDSPYLSPVPLRGLRNDPRNLTHIAHKVAELRGVSYEYLCGLTRKNGLDLFRLGEGL